MCGSKHQSGFRSLLSAVTESQMNLNISGTKKRYRRKKNAILLYFEKPLNYRIFGMTYFSGHMHFKV